MYSKNSLLTNKKNYNKIKLSQIIKLTYNQLIKEFNLILIYIFDNLHNKILTKHSQTITDTTHHILNFTIRYYNYITLANQNLYRPSINI